jgi:crossover junction endodeoxyribonuclease RuvC
MGASPKSSEKFVRILGIDPGSRLCGYGIVDCDPHLKRIRHITHGTLRLANTGGKAVIPLERRLLSIYEGLSQIITEFKPSILSVERVFFAKNAVSALKLGQARGAVILSGAIHGLEIAEYSPSEVKSALVGHGQADKFQVAKMVEVLLGKQKFATSDASDGLALAICHAQMVQLRSAIRDQEAPGGQARQAIQRAALSARRGNKLADALGISVQEVDGKKSWTRTRKVVER